MKPPAPPSHSLRDLRELTPARVGLGRAGASLPTDALLAFTLDHARARDAVHAAFDVSGLMAGLRGLGLEPVEVQPGSHPARLSPPSRSGRLLDPASAD
jgi:ethanolamine ammonia-lyase small subunit